jgi:hypothetical protein
MDEMPAFSDPPPSLRCGKHLFPTALADIEDPIISGIDQEVDIVADPFGRFGGEHRPEDMEGVTDRKPNPPHCPRAELKR